jgi:GTP cyclohydrolase II
LFTPSPTETIDRARNDLRIGLPIYIIDKEKCWLIFSIETISSERFSNLDEVAEFCITEKRAKTLKATPYYKQIGRFHLEKSKGIGWIKAVANPVKDLNYPMKGPFKPLRSGSADAHQLGILLCKKARLLPAIIAQRVEKREKDITTISTKHSKLIDLDREIVNIAGANLPLGVSKNSKLHIFRPLNGSDENYALEIGTIDRSQPVLCRLHSACFTGDLLGSLKCDCGAQLTKALQLIGDENQGILLYLNQEGRGIGLANKMRAYALQNQGFDTVEANHRLGFEDEERDFEIGAKILKELGFESVKLMTNNPEKIKMMETHGIKVAERVPLKTELTKENKNYLATKVKKSGHLR